MGRKITIGYKTMTAEEKTEYHRAQRRKRGVRAVDYVGLKHMTSAQRQMYNRAIRYGLTLTEYAARMAIGRCEACDATDGLVLDHQHEEAHTRGRYRGKIRGVLCSNCNTALGLMNDSPGLLRQLAAYVEQYTS